MANNYGPGENLTLTLAKLEAYRNQGPGLRSGGKLRYFCPIHESDHQRSLELNPETGHFKCHACGTWGYLAEKREEWRAERRWGSGRRPHRGGSGVSRSNPPKPPQAAPEPPGVEARADLAAVLVEFQKALPGSWGEKYLQHRGIGLEVAQAYGVGYAPPGKWPHFDKSGRPVRQWKWGRLVFPHTNAAGEVVNLYGRALEGKEKAPRDLAHDHLPGPKGIFNARALRGQTVFVCEGVFDALSLAAAGYREACAIFGLQGLRWKWVEARRLVFCFDQDTGGEKWKELAWQGRLLGKEIYFFPPESYGHHKDLNEFWVATGHLDIGRW